VQPLLINKLGRFAPFLFALDMVQCLHGDSKGEILKSREQGDSREGGPGVGHRRLRKSQKELRTSLNKRFKKMTPPDSNSVSGFYKKIKKNRACRVTQDVASQILKHYPTH